MAFLTKRPNGIWYIVESEGGSRKFRSTGKKSTADAHIVLANHNKNKRKLFLKKFTLSDLKQSILNDARANDFSKSTLQIYNNVFKHLNYLFGDKELNTFTIDDINKYKIHRKKDIKLVSCNVELRSLKKFFRFAFKNNLVAEDMSLSIGLYTIKDDQQKIFSEEEKQLIFNALPEGEFKDICSITYLTGSRRNEILNLKYEDINLANGLINIYQQKPKKEKTIKQLSISEALKCILKKYFYNDDETLKYFHAEDKIFHLTPSYVSHKFKKHLRKLGLNESLHFHSLRHTAATDLLKRGSSMSKLKFILGHSSIKVTEGYTHLIPEDTKNDLNKLSLMVCGK